MRTVAAVLALVACVHAGLWASLRTREAAPDFRGQLASVSYAPFVASSHPDWGERPTVEQIRADLKAIAPYTRAIRTYSSTGGAELVPPIAAEFGLKVTVGAWIDKNHERNEREIRSALDLALHNSNVNAIVVGNETMLRNETSVDDLIKLIQRVKKSSPVPVTTGENWSAWIDHPELASAVDFIAAHILPYWAGFDASTAVDHTIEIYDQLRRLHPGKRIVIAEFGWPSAVTTFATPIRAGWSRRRCCGTSSSRRGLRHRLQYHRGNRSALEDGRRRCRPILGPARRLTRAEILLDRSDHRSGLYQAGRPCRAVRAPAVVADPRDPGRNRAQALMLAGSANLVGAWVAAIAAFWTGHYFVFGAAFALGLGLILLVPLVAIALARIERDCSDRFWAGAAPACLFPAAGAGSVCAESINSHSGLPRTAGDAQRNPRRRRPPRLPQPRMRAGHQQHARPCTVAAG